MSLSVFLILNVGITGAFWRAVFVAAIAIIAFALARYWKGLSGYSKQYRLLLVCLRGLSMLILASALVGVKVEYETHQPLRILIHHGSATRSKNGARELAEKKATARVIASLKSVDVDEVEQSDMNDVTNSIQSADYPAAALFITDGSMRPTDARREIENASVASGGAPVFVVTDLQESDSPRVAINSVTVMNRALRGVPLQVRCLLHARGMRGRETLVTVADDAQVRTSAKVLWTGDDERQVLTIDVVPQSAGWVNYLVSAEASGFEDPAKLSRPFTVYAEERRQRILIMEGEPTWETKFIRRALEKADLFDVDYFAQISRAAMVGARDQQQGSDHQTAATKQLPDGRSPEARLREALSSAARLNIYDCIIVGATPDTLLSNAEAIRVREWLERRGGGLIILGGNNFAGSIVAAKGKLGSLMPNEIDSSGVRSDSQTLALSAPVDAEKSGGQIVLVPTDAGKDGALHAFSLATEGDAGKGVLSGEGLRLKRLRPGTTVLAVTGQAGTQGRNDSGAPLIASMRYGTGRAIVFAPTDSWRLRTTATGDQSDNDGPFAALWQGLTLWASSGARPPVEIVLGDDSPEAGDEATAEIRVRDEALTPLTIEKMSGRLQQVSESEDATQAASFIQEVSFTPDTNDPSIWRAHFTAPPVGRFSLQINYVSTGKSGVVEKYFATVAPSSIEEGASRDTLERIARETGGDLYPVSKLKSLSDRLAGLPTTKQNVHRTIDLRSWWPLALIIPLLLSCEWLIVRLKASNDSVSDRFAEV